MDTLERAITQAHRSGDQALLEKLQVQYRGEVGSGIRDAYRDGPPPQVVEGRRTSPPRSPLLQRKGAPLVRKVVLSRSARDTINGFRYGETSPVGSSVSWLDRETGGALLGMIAGSGIFVNFATEWVRAERGRDFIRHDPDEIAHLEEVYRYPVCGDWHLHPGQAVPKPSGQDRSAWGKRAGTVGQPWASIIIGDNGSPFWPMKAWITKFNGGNTHTFAVPLIEEE
jgi:hypothetical protein